MTVQANARVEADLVVDATGRAGRTPAALDGHGLQPPRRGEGDRARRVFQSAAADAAGHAEGDGGGHDTPMPGRPTGMALFGCEDDTWMFTAFGMAGREPPTEPDDRLAFVEAITPPHVMDALRNAEPITEICRYRYPENRWRRYDKMKRFPAGTGGDRRRGGQLQPDLRPGHDGGRTAGSCLARLPISRRAAIWPDATSARRRNRSASLGSSRSVMISACPRSKAAGR